MILSCCLMIAVLSFTPNRFPSLSLVSPHKHKRAGRQAISMHDVAFVISYGQITTAFSTKEDCISDVQQHGLIPFGNAHSYMKKPPTITRIMGNNDNVGVTRTPS
ncbi:hypothetical protein M406DRAFT_354497 [Cryphonectria parasitica EP155]|uniref:Uncharacterized protein n=1 Tax=Cryphonectria parasitica (strain ATCC 38755 / EP155) TaxID=660469 RepID=A0A9P4YCI2_CRYP1|nr:uncharacterized protein M406DRAFT_354497 [Cryphonectria parasitica EP155]KAF3770546.1 hypothetical protein M406DRAFT_354497 [Cryphonectria parasitica EP155]